MHLAFSRIEVYDLFKSWLAVSLAFTIASVGLQFNMGVVIIFGILAFSAGIGFVLHELAHKVVAQRFGAFAEFRSNDQMLLIMLLVSAFGFIFAAPGAVFTHGSLSFDKYGKISLAGPLMNIVLALLFFGLTFTQFALIGHYGATINAWLAVFNLLPFPMFDGFKVLAWNRWVWALAGIAAVAVLLLTF